MQNALFDFISQYITLSPPEKEAKIDLDLFKAASEGSILLREGQISKQSYFVLKGLHQGLLRDRRGREDHRLLHRKAGVSGVEVSYSYVNLVILLIATHNSLLTTHNSQLKPRNSQLTTPLPPLKSP